MYKLIATDLDETLLTTTDRSVTPENRRAIAQARKKGVKFVLATGRPYFSTLGTQKEIDVYRRKGEYTISLNGAVLIDNETEKPLFVEGLDFDTIHQLFVRGIPYDVGVHIYTDNKVYGYHISEDEKNYLHNRLDIEILDSPDLSFLKDASLIKILFVNTDENYLRMVAADLSDLSQDLEVSYSSNRYLEFNKAGIHKGFGLQKLAEILKIPMEETIGIGDNFNDLGMIQAAGLGAGVANSNPGIIPTCDVITENDCNHDAIAEIIDRYILFEDHKETL